MMLFDVRRSLFLSMWAVAAACGSPAPPAPAATPPSAGEADAAGPVTAFVNVRVLSMLDETAREHQTVVVRGTAIAAVGPVDRVPVPSGATRVDGAGRTLVPGFADMHVHLPDDDAPPGELDRIVDLSLASGVTLVRGMQGAPGQLAARARLRAGRRPAPALVLAGPPVAAQLSPDAARLLVRAQHDAGYDAIKILGGIDLPAYQAITAEAGQLAMPVCGHVPAAIGLDAALSARQSSVEHLMGYDAAARGPEVSLDDLARRTAAARVWNCPTLDFFAVGSEMDEAVLLRRGGLAHARADELEAWRRDRRASLPSPDAAGRMEERRRITAALARAGAPLLVGSDSPGAFALPGFAYVEEMRQLVRAGLRPSDVLRAATRSAAEYLDESDRRGAVAPGMLADLVLLDGDPRASIEAVARPAGVMVRGRWLPRRELDQLLARHRVR